MASLGSLVLDLEARTSPFDKALKKSESRLDSLGSAFQHAQRKAGRMFGALKTGNFRKLGGELSSMLKPALVSVAGGFLNLASAAAKATAAIAAAGAVAAGAFVASSVKSAAAMETTRTQFAVMLGDAEKADKMLKQLFDFSKVTPFTPEQVFQGGRQLLLGFESGEVAGELKTLGDIAAGSGADLAEIAKIYARIKLQGSATMAEINMFTDRGVKLQGKLAEMLGRTPLEIKKMVAAGEIGFPKVQAALQAMTAEGGMFFGAMEKQSKTLNGLWSTLTGNFEAGKVALGESFIESTKLKDILKELNEAVKGFDWEAAGKSAADAFMLMKDTAALVVPVLSAINEELSRAQKLTAYTFGVLGQLVQAAPGATLVGADQAGASLYRTGETYDRYITQRRDNVRDLFTPGESVGIEEAPQVEVQNGPEKEDVQQTTNAVHNVEAAINAGFRDLIIELKDLDTIAVAKPT